MVDPKVIEKVKLFLRELTSQGIMITRAFLYGSQVRGEASEDSDIDVLIISPLFDGDKFKYSTQIWFAPTRIDYRIEPHAVGEKKFLEDEYSPLLAAIREEGIEIKF